MADRSKLCSEFIYEIRLIRLRFLTKELWKNNYKYIGLLDEKYVDDRLEDPLQEKCELALHRCRPEKIVFDFDPKPIYFKDKLIAIQLRSLKNEEHLVIGCGNQPTTLAYDSALKPEVVKAYHKYFAYDHSYCKICISQNIKEGDLHKHEGAITINPDPEMNPTFVAFFGTYPAINVKVYYENIII